MDQHPVERDFSVAVRAETGYDVMTARGDLDVASAPVFRGALHDHAPQGQPWLVLDLCDLGFLDSIGISAVVAARRLVLTQGQQLVVACGEGPVLRVLRTTRLHEVIEVYPTVAEAAEALA
jgi:anti-sigma B factor antagonist